MLRLRWSFIGSDLILLVVMLVFVGYLVGIFAYFDAFTRDHLSRIAGGHEQSSQVLLVDGAELTPVDLEKFVSALAAHAPAGVLFYAGTDAQSRWQAYAAPRPSFPLYFFSSGRGAVGRDGALMSPPPVRPFLKWHHAWPEAGLSRLFSPSSEWLQAVGLAARYEVRQSRHAVTVFASARREGVAINFSKAPRYLPQVSAKRVLRHDILTDMVAGRWVLVGLDHEVMRPMLTTPLTAPHATTSALAFEGYGLNALMIENGAVRWAPSVLVLMCLVLLALFNIFFLQVLSTMWAVFANVAVFGLLLFLCATGLALGWWLPPTALVFNQIFCFLIIREYARAQSHDLVADMQADLSHQITDKLLPPNFYAQANPWAAITMLLTQQCDLHRCILLERLPNQQRLKEVESLNCAFEDIEERRRDFGREPYLSAMSAKGVVRTNRSYFKSKTADEYEYIAPLIFDGSVEGFWAFTVDEQVEKSGKLDWTVVNSFAQEIAELMFHHKQWQIASAQESNWVVKLLRIQADQDNFQNLKKSVQLMERRLTVLEDVFNNMVTCAVLYNLFGQIVKANSQLEALARAKSFPLYNRSALDTLCALCELPAAKARDYLYRVTVCGESISLPARALAGDGSYMLHIRAISMDNATTGAKGVAAPFRILGILFELIDALEVNYNTQLVDDLNYQLMHQLRNNLSAMALALRHHKRMRGGEQQSTFTQMISDKIDETSRLLNDVQSHQEISRLGGDDEVIPLDVVRIFNRVLSGFNEPLADKQIEISAMVPNHYGLALVCRSTLQHFYSAMLRLLIEDASPQSAIQVIVENSVIADRAMINFAARNQGVGVLPETITQLYESVSQVFSDKMSALEKFIFFARLLRAQDCIIEIQSDVGRGYNVKLSLKALSLQFTESEFDGQREQVEPEGRPRVAGGR